MDPQDEIDSYFLSTLKRVLGDFDLTLADVEVDLEHRKMNVVTKMPKEKNDELAHALEDAVGEVSR